MAIDKSHTGNGWKVTLALVTTGIGIGWLAGLSVSPVVSIILSSVTGVVTAIIALLSGVKLTALDGIQVNFTANNGEDASQKTRLRQWQVNPIPIAWLMFGLMIGSSSGIWVRTHDLLSPRTPSLSEEVEVARWEALGLNKEDVAARLFEQKFPLPGQSLTLPTQSATSPGNSILFTGEAKTTCEALPNLLLKQDFEEIRKRLRVFPIPSIRQLPDVVTDDEQLAEVTKILCAMQ